MVTLIPLSLPIVTHPRLRGEDIPKLGDTWQYADSPPLARGILVSSKGCPAKYRLTPACAGNMVTLITFVIADCDSPPLTRGIRGFSHRKCSGSETHPRLHGEYRRRQRLSEVFGDSPPPARGIREIAEISSLWRGLTPACAGNTLSVQERW